MNSPWYESYLLQMFNQWNGLGLCDTGDTLG